MPIGFHLHSLDPFVYLEPDGLSEVITGYKAKTLSKSSLTLTGTGNVKVMRFQ